MTHRNEDIEALILALQRAEFIARDETLDPAIREDALIRFLHNTSPALIECLDELKELRNQIAKGETGGTAFNKTHRVIVEGYSDKDAGEALSSALDKAAKYFSEDHDIAITVQQLLELPDGGHRATIEVHITPLSLKNKAHVKGADIELKRDRNHAYYDTRRKEEEVSRHFVFEHFATTAENPDAVNYLPASVLIDISDAKLMHYMLEKEFLKAEMGHTPDSYHPSRILVKTRNAPEPEPERDFE